MNSWLFDGPACVLDLDCSNQQDLSVHRKIEKEKEFRKIKLSSYTCEIKNRQLADKKSISTWMNQAGEKAAM